MVAAQIRPCVRPGTLKIDLAQFRELEAFAAFGSELDKVSQAQLDRGPAHRTAQAAQNAPVPVEEQVVVIYAGSNGWVDDVPVSEVRRFESEMLRLHAGQPRRTSRRHPDTGEPLPRPPSINKVLQEFKDGFDAKEGG